MSHILVIGPQTIDANKQQRGVRLEILTFGEPAEYSRPAVARKPRIEIAGGLYHLITRGNNRKRIFQSHDVGMLNVNISSLTPPDSVLSHSLPLRLSG